MTIEEIRSYAKESGFSENKIAELIAELHPDENGKLSLQESIQATATIDYVVELRKSTKAMLEAVRAERNRIGTEYMTFGQWPDGRWAPLYSTRTKDDQETAEIKKNKYIEAVKKDPHLYPKYKQFKLMKRTVATTSRKWVDV
jgi:hypothetical protein